LTNKNEHPSIINFYSYLGLTFVGLLICNHPIFTEEILRAFTNNKNIISIGITGFKYTILLLPITGFQLITTSYFQSIKQPVKAIIINVSRQFIFLIPALIILSPKMGLDGIWLSTPIADGLVIIPTIIILALTKATKKG
jgi:Na+-driven multidrug efflux pump